MLAVRLRLGNVFELVRGPFHKRGRAYVRVETAYGIQELSIDEARAGSDIADGLRVGIAGGRFHLTLPAEACLEQLGALTSRTLWRGSHVTIETADPGARSLALSVPVKSTLRITLGTEKWILALAHARPEACEPRAATLSPRGFLLKLFDFTRSIGVHAAFLLVAAVAGNVLNIPWLQLKPETAETDPVPVQVMQPIVFEQSSESDFAGRGLVQAPAPDPGAAATKKAEKINTKLSSLVSRMSRLNFGNIGKTAEGRDGSVTNAMLDALRGRIGKVRGADLRDNFKILGQGSGKNSNWNLFGDARNDVSAKDLERVAEIFRSMQEDFRGCYESALLKFNALSVVVQYESEVTGDGRLGSPAYSMSGKSDAASESALKSCLTRVLNQVSLGKSLSGARIRNQFIFRS